MRMRMLRSGVTTRCRAAAFRGRRGSCHSLGRGGLGRPPRGSGETASSHRARPARAGALLAAAALLCLAAGCDSCEESPSPPPPEPTADPTFRALQAAGDPAVKGLSLQVAWCIAREGQLPKDRQDIEKAVTASAWPDLPERTTGGRPVAYRPTGDRTFEIVVGDPEAPASKRTVIALVLPADMPTDMEAEAFAAWWELEFLRQQADVLKARLRELGG